MRAARVNGRLTKADTCLLPEKKREEERKVGMRCGKRRKVPPGPLNSKAKVMNELLGKLSDLSYEVFGIFLPGLIAILFIVAWWAAIGDLAPHWSFGHVPRLTTVTTERIINGLDAEIGIGIAVPLIFLSYFVGNALVWISRTGSPDGNANTIHLLRLALTLKIPKPEHSYSPQLQSLLDAAAARLGPSSPLTWRQFYPVVKSVLSESVSRSLIPTYQNKYTFHRSIVMAAATLFWLSATAVLGALVTRCYCSIAPHWAALAALLAASLAMVLGFTRSYRLYWEMFGNATITEAYSLLCVLKDGH